MKCTWALRLHGHDFIVAAVDREMLVEMKVGWRAHISWNFERSQRQLYTLKKGMFLLNMVMHPISNIEDGKLIFIPPISKPVSFKSEWPLKHYIFHPFYLCIWHTFLCLMGLVKRERKKIRTMLSYCTLGAVTWIVVVGELYNSRSARLMNFTSSFLTFDRV